MRTTKKIALVTGGAKGLGREIAVNLVDQGYSVIIFDIERYDRLPVEYQNLITNYFEIDLANFAEVSSLLDRVLEKYPKIDVFINNAAMRLFKYFCEFNELEIDQYINVNYKIPILLTKRIYSVMKSYGHGRIINISSVSAFSGYSCGSMYCSTKCALTKFTESFSREISKEDDVTVNAICPDSFSTIEGRRLKGSTHIINSVNHAISRILVSSVNGQVLLILRKQSKLLWVMTELKKILVRLWRI